MNAGNSGKTTKLLALAALLLASLAFAGCSSVEAAKSFNGQANSGQGSAPVAQVNGDVWGCYLFGAFPLVTGDPDYPGTTCFFKDTVRLEPTVKMVTSRARSLGAESSLVLESRTDSSGAAGFWIVYVKEVQVSGNAVKAAKEEPKK